MGSAYAWAQENFEDALKLLKYYLGGVIGGPENIEKSISTLEKRLAEHEKTLADYKANPDAHDNKGFLKNATSPEQRERIIQKRIRNLQDEIHNFKRMIGSLKARR